MLKKFKVIWSDFAVKQLDLIFEYYAENASKKTAKKLIKNLLQEPEKLIKNNQIGQIEELLVNKNKAFRYLIYKKYKIIYLIDEKEKL
ncbi:MAG: type II toxin-antitoxin system RelE/ParE family toxin, partial [Vicingaceae bacterium]|nr:type II toxin-antitoxin system RelE/ParE family toxin [Vicingaceae bacterium]